jgi:hypothetical protein
MVDNLYGVRRPVSHRAMDIIHVVCHRSISQCDDNRDQQKQQYVHTHIKMHVAFEECYQPFWVTAGSRFRPRLVYSVLFK